jgi:hypothetical protein
VREQQVRPVWVQPEPLARLAARDRPEALQVDPHREHRHAPRGARAGDVLAELARDRRRQRGERQRRARDPVRARVEEVVAVQRHDHGSEAGEDRRPRGQAEVRVDDVEVAAGVAAAQLARGGGVGAQPGREREDLDLDVVAPAQRLDLVEHEAPVLGPLGRRVHVRDDQGSHGTNMTRIRHERL